MPVALFGMTRDLFTHTHRADLALACMLSGLPLADIGVDKQALADMFPGAWLCVSVVVCGCACLLWCVCVAGCFCSHAWVIFSRTGRGAWFPVIGCFMCLLAAMGYAIRMIRCLCVLCASLLSGVVAPSCLSDP